MGPAVTDDTADEDLLAAYLDVAASPSARQRAFGRLVDRYQRRVFAVCLQVLGDASDAEEATQETFIKLARGADRFRGDARLSTWLYRVARNAATDLVRRDARRPATPVADLTDLPSAPVERDPTSGTAEVLDVRVALDQLDPLSRQLLLLIAVEGLSYAEAAAATDVAVGTVKSRVSRARSELATWLTDTSTPGPAPGHGDRDVRPDQPPRSGPGGPRAPPAL